MKVLIAGDFCPRYMVCKITKSSEFEEVVNITSPFLNKLKYDNR